VDTHTGNEMSETIPEKENASRIKKYDDMRPESRRQTTSDRIITNFGKFIDVNPAFMVHLGINRGLYNAGLDRSQMISLFDGYSDLTPHKGRKAEIESVQLCMPPQINVLPNAGALGEPEEEKVGNIQRLFRWVRGSDKEGNK